MLSSSIRSLVFLSFASSFISQTLADQTFTSPSSGDKVTIGQKTQITWDVSATYSTIGLSICKSTSDPQNPDCSSIAGNVNNDGEYDWTPSSSLAAGSGYYLIMTTGSTFVGTSPTFSLSGGSSSSTTASSANPTSTGSTTGGSSSSPTQAPATVTQTVGGDTTATSSANGSGSSHSGAAIGGAVGGVIVVLLLAGIAFIIYRKKQNKSRNTNNRPGSPDDVEAGASGTKSKRSSMMGSMDKRPDTAFSEPQSGYVEAGSIPLAELPAAQQEPVEMATPYGGQSFIMELDGREIARPGQSTVQPDADGVGKKTTNLPRFERESYDAEGRGGSIDGTTVDGDGERPKTAGTLNTVEEAKEEARAQESTSQHHEPNEPLEEPATPQQSRPFSGVPQIRSSIPRLPAFDFDSTKF